MADDDIDRRIVVSREEFNRINEALDAQPKVIPELLALLKRVQSRG